MAASVYFPLSPLRGRDQRHDGDLISNRDMQRRMIPLRRARKATRLLLADGWVDADALYAADPDQFVTVTVATVGQEQSPEALSSPTTVGVNVENEDDVVTV